MGNVLEIPQPYDIIASPSVRCIPGLQVFLCGHVLGQYFPWVWSSHAQQIQLSHFF